MRDYEQCGEQLGNNYDKFAPAQEAAVRSTLKIKHFGIIPLHELITQK